MVGAPGGEVLDEDDLLLRVEGEVWVGVDEALETFPDEGCWIRDKVLVVVVVARHFCSLRLGVCFSCCVVLEWVWICVGGKKLREKRKERKRRKRRQKNDRAERGI